MAGGLGPSFFNFSVLVGGLAYVLRKPMKEFVVSRHALLKDEVARVADQLRTAQSRSSEFKQKLDSLSTEVSSLRAQVKQDAEAAKVRIVQEASQLSKTIVSDARASAISSFGELKSQLRAELASRVLDRAEKILQQRLTQDDRVRIRKDFSSQVERMPNPAERVQ